MNLTVIAVVIDLDNDIYSAENQFSCVWVLHSRMIYCDRKRVLYTYTQTQTRAIDLNNNIIYENIK